MQHSCRLTVYIKSSRCQVHIISKSDDDSYWMAATTYRTFYNTVDAIDFLVDVDKLRGDGWGPWHELGHQHQISSLTWNETVEVTVNIYSLAVERALGLESRLKRDGVWDKVGDFFTLPIEQRNYNSDQLGLFARLGLYQQLWLKYGDDFFIDLHKLAREERLQLNNSDEKMSYFMLKASEVTGNNLGGFFKEWGFVLPKSSYDEVDALGFPVPDEDLTKLRE